MATGLPSARPWRTPAVTVARSFSIFMRPPRPWPSWRRARSTSMSSGVNSRPAGTPSTIAVSPGPWDSPAVTNRKDMTPTPYKRGCGRQVGGGNCLGGGCLEGNAARAAARVGIRGAWAEGVDSPVDAADVDRRNDTLGLAAPGGIHPAHAVAVQVVLDLVQLGDVAVVVRVLVVLAVEQRVAVDVAVREVEVGERAQGVRAGPLAAVFALLPGLDRAALGLPVAGPEARVARASCRLEEVREPVDVRVALVVVVDAGVAVEVVGRRERLARVREAEAGRAPDRRRRDVARAAELGAVAVAQAGLEAHAEASRVEVAAGEPPGAVLLERREPVAVEVVVAGGR